jgi:hypothetical protein
MASGAQAQAVATTGATACPQLPAASGLNWIHKGSAGAEFCQALRADGSEAFGLYIASAASQRPAGRRGEEGVIDGHKVRWYRGDLPSQPQVLVREAQFELDNGRTVRVWLHAADAQQLGTTLKIVQGLRFEPAQLSRN